MLFYKTTSGGQLVYRLHTKYGNYDCSSEVVVSLIHEIVYSQSILKEIIDEHEGTKRYGSNAYWKRD